MKSSLEQFNELIGDDKESPIERLRFFCSIAMNSQDWLDVEPFFDALATQPQAPQGGVIELALEALDDDSPYGRLQAQRLLRDSLAGIMPCPECKGQGGGEGWIANENDRSGQSDYRAWVDCTQCNPNTPPTGVDAAPKEQS